MNQNTFKLISLLLIPDWFLSLDPSHPPPRSTLATSLESDDPVPILPGRKLPRSCWGLPGASRRGRPGWCTPSDTPGIWGRDRTPPAPGLRAEQLVGTFKIMRVWTGLNNSKLALHFVYKSQNKRLLGINWYKIYRGTANETFLQYWRYARLQNLKGLGLTLCRHI